MPLCAAAHNSGYTFRCGDRLSKEGSEGTSAISQPVPTPLFTKGQNHDQKQVSYSPMNREACSCLNKPATFGLLREAALAEAKTELQEVTYSWLYRFYVAKDPSPQPAICTC
jgi:hypothetical protein